MPSGQQRRMPIQLRPHIPQFPSTVRLCSQPSDGSPLQSSKSALQVKPHAPPMHVRVEFGRFVHTTQPLPHASTLLFETQVDPLRQYPELQVKSHTSGFPMQVALPLGGGEQGVQRVPQVAVSSSDTQLPPQRW